MISAAAAGHLQPILHSREISSLAAQS